MYRNRTSMSLTLITLLATGCGNTPHDPATNPPTPPVTTSVTTSPPNSPLPPPCTNQPAPGCISTVPDPGEVNYTDPDAVALAAIITLYTWPTGTSPYDAITAARTYLTSQLYNELHQSRNYGGGTYHAATAADGHTIIEAYPTNELGQPTATDTTAYSTITWTIITIDRHGHITTQNTTTNFITLTKETTGWAVQNL